MTRVQWKAYVVPGGAAVDVIADNDSTTPVLSIESPSDISGGGVTVDNQSDPPAEVTTIVAPGAPIVDGTVTLPYIYVEGLVTTADVADGEFGFSVHDGSVENYAEVLKISNDSIVVKNNPTMGTYFGIGVHPSGNDVLRVGYNSGTDIMMLQLPTADPGVAGQIYSNGVPSAGVPRALMVSGG